MVGLGVDQFTVERRGFVGNAELHLADVLVDTLYSDKSSRGKKVLRFLVEETCKNKAERLLGINSEMLRSRGFRIAVEDKCYAIFTPRDIITPDYVYNYMENVAVKEILRRIPDGNLYRNLYKRRCSYSEAKNRLKTLVFVYSNKGVELEGSGIRLKLKDMLRVEDFGLGVVRGKYGGNNIKYSSDQYMCNSVIDVKTRKIMRYRFNNIGDNRIPWAHSKSHEDVFLEGVAWVLLKSTLTRSSIKKVRKELEMFCRNYARGLEYLDYRYVD